MMKKIPTIISSENDKNPTFTHKDIYDTKTYQSKKLKLPMVLGKSLEGKPVVEDLATLPNLLVIGEGPDTSNALHAMILSLINKLTVDTCRMIMIDPKMLELAMYEGIPYLLAPVVYDAKRGVEALKWAVGEMEQRYMKLARLGVRNIEGHNKRIEKAKASGEQITRNIQTGFAPDTGQPLFKEEVINLTTMPTIVIIIDEIADLMLTARDEVEGHLQRLSLMSRAVGIHLIVGTQSPSDHMMTQMVKANFPARLVCKLSSKEQSKQLLGETGAELLSGTGDRLYRAGGSQTTQVQGAFVSDEEVEEAVKLAKIQGASEYTVSFTEEQVEEDELYDKAVDIIQRDGNVSISNIQRSLKIGYNRAAHLLEMMEENGVISAPSRTGKREILVPKK